MTPWQPNVKRRPTSKAAMRRAEAKLEAAVKRAFKPVTAFMIRNWERDLPLSAVAASGRADGLPQTLRFAIKDNEWERFTAEMAREMAEGLSLALEMGADAGRIDLEGIVVDWNLNNPAAKRWMRRWSLDLVKGLLQTTRDRLRATLAAGLGLGESRDELALRVRALVDDIPAWRARLIAQTEVIRSYSQGSQQIYRASGVVEKKRWLDGQADACAAPWTAVQTPKGNVPIALIRPGDLVRGGSGQYRKVIAVARREWEGNLVLGNLFGFTPDHRFLSWGGWREIGDYLGSAKAKVAHDLVIGETQYRPANLSEIVVLPNVSGLDQWPFVPEAAITLDDYFSIWQSEINDPVTLHQNLFSKRNAHTDQQIPHCPFDIRANSMTLPVLKETGLRAVFRAANPGRKGLKESATIETTKKGFRLPVGVTLSRHQSTVFTMGVMALVRTKPSSRSLPFVFEFEGCSAPFTVKPNIRHCHLLTVPDVLASAATEPCTAPSPGLGNFPRLTTDDAMNRDSTIARMLLAFWKPHHKRPPVHLTRACYKGWVYDLQIEGDVSFMLANGLVAHNCPLCQELNGAEVGLDEDFEGGVDGPPRHPGCRCAVRGIVAGG